ncbi:MAG: AAA family ATPase, partial [Fretibacterium sp.]
MSEKLQTLPIGIQSFEMLRKRGHLYVDKTAQLMELVNSDRCFLSRPRRFGKSLTLSTLDAMFQGKAELFKGLAAEGWVAEQAKRPAPVLRLDMSMMNVRDVAHFEGSLNSALTWRAEDAGVTLSSKQPSDKFQKLIRAFYKQGGPVVVLIDEYDKPILDKIGNLEAAEAMREALRGFYTVLKGCDEYLRFVMLTGISKFTKTGVFSAMNNLDDISMDWQFGDIVGYTQEELEADFSGWIGAAAEKMNATRETLLERMKDYYDGFCFDGKTRLYNPFSVMQCLGKAR